MGKEYEYTFATFNRTNTIKKLQEIKAKQVGIYLFKICVFTHPLNKPNTYIRIRDEGHRVTMTIKSDLQQSFATENEVNINDFKTGIEIYKQLGCKIKYQSEKIREIWECTDGSHISFDMVPGKPERMEIESPTQEILDNLTKKLGFNPADSVTKNENDIYFSLFGVKVPNDMGLDFENVEKNLGPLVTKNKKEFTKLINLQKQYYEKIKKMNNKS
jgi:predicted adenylyl cyclase CyaB